ncbi:hypothetical protein [Paraburkholderia sediminicola]|uniref:hypothetical protein n=1 Tax=Paraburkholderia sediminicola TaxID=458836 RepID=UPI0038BA5A54
METKIVVPDVESLAKLYQEAVRANHVGKAETLKASMLKMAAAEGAAAEALALKSFADKLG